jgi:hypothetical protein
MMSTSEPAHQSAYTLVASLCGSSYLESGTTLLMREDQDISRWSGILTGRKTRTGSNANRESRAAMPRFARNLEQSPQGEKAIWLDRGHRGDSRLLPCRELNLHDMLAVDGVSCEPVFGSIFPATGRNTGKVIWNEKTAVHVSSPISASAEHIRRIQGR